MTNSFLRNDGTFQQVDYASVTGTSNVVTLLSVPQFIMGSSGTNGSQFAAGTTAFITPSLASTNEALVELTFPSSGTVKNLRAFVQGSPGAGQTYTVTFRNATSDTSLTCTISSGTNKGSDLTNAPLVTAGSVWSVKFVSSVGAATTNLVFALEYDAA